MNCFKFIRSTAVRRVRTLYFCNKTKLINLGHLITDEVKFVLVGLGFMAYQPLSAEMQSVYSSAPAEWANEVMDYSLQMLPCNTLHSDACFDLSSEA